MKVEEITREEYEVEVINSISTIHKHLRNQSKGPTFALQYMGTPYTLHKNAGFSMELATQIYQAFYELYAVSAKFNEANKVFAEEHGYVECAFGLKLRTPLISQCILGNSKTPYEAEAEVRSANNAVTQSWGMLLNRCMIATNTQIEQAGYHLDILPINMIHDAGYFLVRNNPKIIKFLNDTLIKEMEWNDHPVIKSLDVPMKAELELGKSWDKMVGIPNNSSEEEINAILSRSAISS